MSLDETTNTTDLSQPFWVQAGASRFTTPDGKPVYDVEVAINSNAQVFWHGFIDEAGERKRVVVRPAGEMNLLQQLYFEKFFHSSMGVIFQVGYDLRDHDHAELMPEFDYIVSAA